MERALRDKIKRINSRLIEHFGIPPRDEELPNPLDMIIATILSQNTNDRNSYKAYTNLRAAFPDWNMILDTDREEIEKIVKIAGLGKQKSAAIKGLVTELYKKYGKVSLDFVNNHNNKELLELLTNFQGIGKKTASCVLLFALDRNVCPVDTHVHRTANRLGLAQTSSPDKTFDILNDGFPEGIAHRFHTNLIRLGREVCKPTNPSCGVCPVSRMCKFEGKDRSNTNSSQQRSFMLLDNISGVGEEGKK